MQPLVVIVLVLAVVAAGARAAPYAGADGSLHVNTPLILEGTDVLQALRDGGGGGGGGGCAHATADVLEVTTSDGLGVPGATQVTLLALSLQDSTLGGTRSEFLRCGFGGDPTLTTPATYDDAQHVTCALAAPAESTTHPRPAGAATSVAVQLTMNGGASWSAVGGTVALQAAPDISVSEIGDDPEQVRAVTFNVNSPWTWAVAADATGCTWHAAEGEPVLERTALTAPSPSARACAAATTIALDPETQPSVVVCVEATGDCHSVEYGPPALGLVSAYAAFTAGSGSPSLLTSLNTQSVVRVKTGTWRLYFAAAQPFDHYGVSGMCSQPGTISPTELMTTYVTFACYSHDGSLLDASEVHVTVHGGSAPGTALSNRVARAWVHWASNGAIRSAYNIDSVQHLGTGEYRLHITAGVLQDGNSYVVNALSNAWNTGGGRTSLTDDEAKTATTLKLKVRNNQGSYTNTASNMAVIFGPGTDTGDARALPVGFFTFAQPGTTTKIGEVATPAIYAPHPTGLFLGTWPSGLFSDRFQYAVLGSCLGSDVQGEHFVLETDEGLAALTDVNIRVSCRHKDNNYIDTGHVTFAIYGNAVVA